MSMRLFFFSFQKETTKKQNNKDLQIISIYSIFYIPQVFIYSIQAYVCTCICKIKNEILKVTCN